MDSKLTAEWPVVQISIDVPTVEEAIEVGRMALRAGVDWLEVGTPVLVYEGLHPVRRFAAEFPAAPLFADLKIVDGARKYVVAAAGAGASMVSICGVASDASIREAVAGGRQSGVQVVVDLYASPEPVARAREVEAMGADLIYVHYGGDQRAEDPVRDDTVELIPRVKDVVRVPVGVVTFDVPGAIAAVEAGADVVLVGHPFLTGPDAEAMLTEYVHAVRAARRLAPTT